MIPFLFRTAYQVCSKNKSGCNTGCGLNTTTQKGDFAKTLAGQGYSFPDAIRTLVRTKRRIGAEQRMKGGKTGGNRVGGEWFLRMSEALKPFDYRAKRKPVFPANTHGETGYQLNFGGGGGSQTRVQKFSIIDPNLITNNDRIILLCNELTNAVQFAGSVFTERNAGQPILLPNTIPSMCILNRAGSTVKREKLKDYRNLDFGHGMAYCFQK